jgi:hypothetical protein
MKFCVILIIYWFSDFFKVWYLITSVICFWKAHLPSPNADLHGTEDSRQHKWPLLMAHQVHLPHGCGMGRAWQGSSLELPGCKASCEELYGARVSVGSRSNFQSCAQALWASRVSLCLLSHRHRSGCVFFPLPLLPMSSSFLSGFRHFTQDRKHDGLLVLSTFALWKPCDKLNNGSGGNKKGQTQRSTTEVKTSVNQMKGTWAVEVENSEKDAWKGERGCSHQRQ